MGLRSTPSHPTSSSDLGHNPHAVAREEFLAQLVWVWPADSHSLPKPVAMCVCVWRNGLVRSEVIDSSRAENILLVPTVRVLDIELEAK